MQIKKIFFGYLLFFIFLINLNYAQVLDVSNVNFQIINDQIIIHYNLLGNTEDNYTISLSLHRKSDSTFSLIPKKIAGDIGINIGIGNDKQIIWDIKRELKGILKGKDYYFKVKAENLIESNSLVYWIGGALLTVAGAYIIFIPPPPPDNTIADPPERPFR